MALEASMVFSVEPGIYLPGVTGIRIEDIVVLEGAGARRLTPSPREPLGISEKCAYIQIYARPPGLRPALTQTEEPLEEDAELLDHGLLHGGMSALSVPDQAPFPMTR